MKQLIAILFGFLNLSVIAQYSINWTTSHESPVSNPQFVKMIGPVNDSLLFVVSGQASSLLNDESYFLETFNLNTQEKIVSQQLSLPYLKSKEKAIVEIIGIEQTVCIFYTDFNRSNGKNLLYVSQFNKKGRPVKENILLDSIEAYSASRRGDFNITTNPKKDKFIVFPAEPFEKAANQKIRYSIWNSELKPHTAREFDLPYKAREVELTQLDLGEDENAYFLIKITDLFKRWSPGLPNFKYVMIESISNKKEIKEYEIEIPNKSISDIAFRLDSNNLNIMGLYSDNAKAQEESSGIFYININTDSRKIIKSSFSPYPYLLKAAFLNENQLEKGKELDEFFVKSFLPKKDGSSSFITEQYLFREICTTDMRTGIINCQQNYYYNDLIEINLDPNGKFKSYNIINKAQYSSTSSCLDLSFLGLTDGQNNYFLFYDNNRNPNEIQARKEKLKTFEEGGRGKFLSVKVDNENITSEELSLELDKSENLLVRECVKVDDSSYLVQAGNKRYYRFGVLKLESKK